MLKIEKCPTCGGQLEEGAVNAQNFGVLWIRGPHAWVFSRTVERLQKDSWGFPKVRKDDLPALRCSTCRLVIFSYLTEPRAISPGAAGEIENRKSKVVNRNGQD